MEQNPVTPGTVKPGGRADPSPARKPPMRSPAKAWYLLLALPYIFLLWPSLYNKTEPQLMGFPFFYWYQFAWVIASAILTAIVYLATERRVRL